MVHKATLDLIQKAIVFPLKSGVHSIVRGYSESLRKRKYDTFCFVFLSFSKMLLLPLALALKSRKSIP